MRRMNMKSWATSATLERVTTKKACEEKGCFELAVWLVSFDGVASRLCSKHTMKQMKDSARWAETFGTRVFG